jgi:hypothetical protein
LFSPKVQASVTYSRRHYKYRRDTTAVSRISKLSSHIGEDNAEDEDGTASSTSSQVALMNDSSYLKKDNGTNSNSPSTSQTESKKRKRDSLNGSQLDNDAPSPKKIAAAVSPNATSSSIATAATRSSPSSSDSPTKLDIRSFFVSSSPSPAAVMGM